jgi:hypothetical protein
MFEPRRPIERIGGVGAGLWDEDSGKIAGMTFWKLTMSYKKHTFGDHRTRSNHV